MNCRFLLNEAFRPGPLYELTEWNQLNSATKALLAGMYNEQEIYGVFQPVANDTGVTVKVAYKEVALLYVHLKGSAHLPHYFISSGTTKNNETMARLVLDSILEINWAGNFVSGASALTAIYGNAIFENNEMPGYLSELSMKAIRYAWMLDDIDMRSLATKLYTFNSLTWDSAMRAAFLERYSIKEFLFGDSDHTMKKEFEVDWYFVEGSEKKGWLSWVRYSKRKMGTLPSGQTYKLYISPLINDLPAVLQKSIPILTASDAISFKTGSTLPGLLRPDKLVVYFEYPEALFQTVGLLKQELKCYAAQGVPFSAQLDETGFLSHGIDPPGSEVLDAIESGSWRTKIADMLALAIIQTKNEKLDWQRSIAFIRAALSTSGIDPKSWTSEDNFN